jgi:hypothetical protein
VLVGFHFRSAITTGVKVGRHVGKFAMRHALRPLRIPRDRRASSTSGEKTDGFHRRDGYRTRSGVGR